MLTCQYPYSGGRGQALVLSSQPYLSNQPSFNHGPFRVSVVSLSYQSDVLFRQSARMVDQVRAGVPRVAGLAKQKDARPLAEPARAGVVGPGKTAQAANAPARNVHFRCQLQLVPEPRMTFSQAGNIKLLEAVDELGQSLIPPAPSQERSFGASGIVGASMMAGPMANLTAPLRRPEMPGKKVKTLRGTVDVTVWAPRSNPLKIPLESAAGKTFQNEDRRVIVDSIDTDPATRHAVIVLTIEDLDDLFPAEGLNDLGARARGAMMGGGFGPRVGGDTSQGPIQILTSTGQNAFFQTSIDRDSGRVTLRLPQVSQMGDAKEIRISSIVQATATIPFEFHDLPMP